MELKQIGNRHKQPTGRTVLSAAGWQAGRSVQTGSQFRRLVIVAAVLDTGSDSRLAPVPQQKIGFMTPRKSGDQFDHRTVGERFTSADNGNACRLRIALLTWFWILPSKQISSLHRQLCCCLHAPRLESFCRFPINTKARPFRSGLDTQIPTRKHTCILHKNRSRVTLYRSIA